RVPLMAPHKNPSAFSLLQVFPSSGCWALAAAAITSNTPIFRIRGLLTENTTRLRSSRQPAWSPGVEYLPAVFGYVVPGMRDLGKPGVGSAPGGQKLRIAFDGSRAIAGLFTGQRDAIKGESGMRTLPESPLEGGFGIG